MKIAWQAVCAALLPVKLRDLPGLLDPLVDSLGRYRSALRPSQATVFPIGLGLGFG